MAINLGTHTLTASSVDGPNCGSWEFKRALGGTNPPTPLDIIQILPTNPSARADTGGLSWSMNGIDFRTIQGVNYIIYRIAVCNNDIIDRSFSIVQAEL